MKTSIAPFTDGHNLHFSWTDDGQKWNDLNYAYFASDYGTWGAEKKIYAPYLFQDAKKVWYCIFTPNLKDPVFAITSSPDLINWHAQNYHMVSTPQCLSPFVVPSKDKGGTIYWRTNDGKWYQAVTSDFKKFSPPEEIKELPRSNMSSPDSRRGNAVPVSQDVIKHLVAWKEQADKQSVLDNQTAAQDVRRFANLTESKATLVSDFSKTKSISPLLFGIFFEDINYSADGGLYAEMIQNRDFEYSRNDRREWNSKTAWTPANLSFAIKTDKPVHANNPHYADLKVSNEEGYLINSGYDGMKFVENDIYIFSAFMRSNSSKSYPVTLEILNDEGYQSGSSLVTVKPGDWQKIEMNVKATANISNGKFRLSLPENADISVDIISLFPEKTFKNRRNGLRADLAQTLADLKPKFVRFPGGCLAHGNGLKNMYRWNRTVGPIETRVPQFNIWNYHQTAGLGYFEYFQFCEDIGAEPLPVLPAGVPCQNSSHGGKGQQGGIPMDQMDEYVQEVLDLVEWANGPVTSKWGKVRADAGHPEPFNLKYIGIGNEDLISDVFTERYSMICKAIKAKYPHINVIGTVGPFSEGPDYMDGWSLAKQLKLDLVDEHYYRSPGWFIHHQHFYDNYDRNGTKVYLGEYAAHVGNRSNCIESALAESIYLTSVERNGDVVSMTSYAPLLCKDGHGNWNPDLIYFSNNDIRPTVGYYAQQLFSLNAGDKYVETLLNLDSDDSNALVRVGASTVFDTKNSAAILKIVNILPVNVNIELSLKNLRGLPCSADMFVLAGKPSETKVKPIASKIQMEETCKVKLQPYSLTVIRMPNVSFR